jgi:hypothetical protein
VKRTGTKRTDMKNSKLMLKYMQKPLSHFRGGGDIAL